MTSFTPFRCSLFTGALLFTCALSPSSWGGQPTTAGDNDLKMESTRAPLHVARGIVSVELNHKKIASGVVLANDGRVLSSITAKVAPNDLLEIRYIDGHAVRAHIGHADPALDLALVIPHSSAWKRGIQASSADPLKTDVRAATVAHGKIVPVLTHLLSVASGGDAGAQGSLVAETKSEVLSPGTALLDADGRLVAMTGRACRATAQKNACPPVASLATAAPDLKTFLQKTPSSAAIPTPWLGIGGMPIVLNDPKSGAELKGVRVSALLRGSPAEKAGLLAGETIENADVIVSVDKVPVENPDALAKSLENRQVGDKVTFRILRKGAWSEVSVTLQSAPNL